MRALPGWSVMGVDQVLLELQVTVADVEMPVSSTRARGAELLAPLALFQLALATTPATSAEDMGTSWPTKSILMTLLEGCELTGTIWIPLMGARWNPSVEAPGVAETVKSEELMVKTT